MKKSLAAMFVALLMAGCGGDGKSGSGLGNLTVLTLRDNPIPDDQKAMLRKALPNCKIKFGGMWVRRARRSHFDGRPRDAGIDIRPNPCTVGASAPPPTPNPEVPCCH